MRPPVTEAPVAPAAPPAANGNPPMPLRTITVLGTGPLTTVQDLGRPGLSDLGVGASGAADRRAMRLANRLVGNPPGAAVAEVTDGGFAARMCGGVTVAVTGATGPCEVCGPDGRRRPVGLNRAEFVRDAHELRVGRPDRGLRSYVAFRGGLAVEPVLGSRSADLLAALGPDPLAVDDVVPIGTAPTTPVPTLDGAPVSAPPNGDLTLLAVPGPRHDWFTDDALLTLFGHPWEVTSSSNRVGMRLAGPPLERTPARVGTELPSEGVMRGSLQVPASGVPIVFLADHPVTGGYPVAAVLLDREVDAAAQARPGQRLRLRPAAR